MHQSNATKNQHFLSCAEQRLNALNPAAVIENQRIYSFSLSDREEYKVTLDSPRGRAIESNLVLRDLFSFDVIERGRDRLNFEAFFGQYEVGVIANTVELLRKLKTGNTDTKREIIEIFSAKFMNFLRNPYCIEKALNTIGDLLNFHPTDPELLAQYNAVLVGKKPQQKYLSSQLGITPNQYQEWLSVLFMALFRPRPNEINLMEGVIKNLFENTSLHSLVTVYQYTDEYSANRCLLSDRGFSTPISGEEHLAFSFNLCSNAFITYAFADIAKISPKGTNPQLLDVFRQQPKNVRVVPVMNDLGALAIYNRHVVYQCYRSVYSSSQTIYGLTG